MKSGRKCEIVNGDGTKEAFDGNCLVEAVLLEYLSFVFPCDPAAASASQCRYA